MTLKILTWNCNGALRKKFEHIIEFNADLYIIQECEDPSKTNNLNYTNWAKNYLWIGDNKNKGIGIFSNEKFSLIPLNWDNQYKNSPTKYFLPFRFNNDLNFLAVWTHYNNSPNFGYIGQLWKYIQINKENLKGTIIVGDFNSNSIWDQWDRWWNHSDVVKELNEIGLVSFYHNIKNEVQGKESIPTLYFQRKLERPYHIDYIFGPIQIANNLKSIEIGNKEKWLSISDHMPILIELNTNNKKNE